MPIAESWIIRYKLYLTIVIIFRKPYSILLSFSEGELHLISIFYNVFIGFAKYYKLYRIIWTSSSCFKHSIMPENKRIYSYKVFLSI